MECPVIVIVKRYRTIVIICAHIRGNIAYGIAYSLVATAIRIYNWFVELPNYKWWIIGLAMGGSIVTYGLCKAHTYRKRVLKE